MNRSPFSAERLTCPENHSFGWQIGALVAFFVLLGTPLTATAAVSGDVDERIQSMKDQPRGPFMRIRWFCADGSVLPPTAGACVELGGGVQHGEYSATTRSLRAEGYRIANVMADLDIDSLLAEPRADEALAQFAIEQFLRRVDNGWILRRALHYRGALQDEDERAGALALLLKMAGDERWFGRRYLSLRTLAALLPHGDDTRSAKSVRQDASMLAERAPAFLTIKNKIHISPAAADATTVREYAAAQTDAELSRAFEQLAADIDALYAVDTAAVLTKLAANHGVNDPELVRIITAVAPKLAAHQAALTRFTASGRLLRALREALPNLQSGKARLSLIDASLSVEATHFVAATELQAQTADASRNSRLLILAASADANFGTGLLSKRQLQALKTHLKALQADAIALVDYRYHIDYLGLATGWADRHLNFNFGDGMHRLARIEPLAQLFIQDHLRGSPMFFYADVIDGLLRDANRLAGVQHRLFETTIGSGLRALNPGIARGVLRDGRDLEVADFSADGIYLLPETTADLPPVAGILTAGEGNPLSHVQLLARNLGIPNVSIAANQLELLAAHQNKPVVLAVSRGGAVHILADDGSFDAMFEQAAERPGHLIEPELEKLNLEQRDVLELGALRADDSGRTVGPKAAKLGELKAHYPNAVADGLALPFGLFRALLDKPAVDGKGTMFDYIVSGYRALEQLPAGSSAQVTATETLRATIEQWVGAQRLNSADQLSLRDKLINRLGEDGSFGVFVRSDTNVEDLPGFTGAGLNLTVANVVGIDNIIAAISRVWASPFTARAFSWRQALMREPEHVYPAVLLLESVNADKSGVLVTQDIDSGDRGWISVAVNEGVGGAVDGQSAESLRIHLASGEVRLLAQASASIRRQVSTTGGVDKLAASGRDVVLEAAEIAQLIDFTRALPEQFPAIVDADGRPAPADVEFGFQDGELRLFQIRPFLDNAAAEGNQYLIGMDPDAGALAGITVDLQATP